MHYLSLSAMCEVYFGYNTHIYKPVRFQVLTEVLLMIQVFWDVTTWCYIPENLHLHY